MNAGGGNNAYAVYTTSDDVKTDGASSTTDGSSSTTGTVETSGGHTVVVTAASETDGTSDSKKDSGPNTAAIAAGVVVGVVGFCALVGAGFFLWRFRKRKSIEDEYRRNADINNFAKPKSAGSMSNSRFDGDFMAQRRQSNGSIDDDQDFSRRILQVNITTNNSLSDSRTDLMSSRSPIPTGHRNREANQSPTYLQRSPASFVYLLSNDPYMSTPLFQSSHSLVTIFPLLSLTAL